ncbi:EpsG family protein [Shewanella sp. 0m-4]
MNQVIYNLFLFCSVAPLFLIYTKQFKHSKPVMFFLSWIIVFVVSVVRFDVGPDYMAYVEAVNSVLKYGESVQLDYWFLSKLTLLFSGVDNTFFYVLATYFFVTYGLILNRWSKECSILIALMVFICFGFYFDSLDRVRQFLAISIFFFSYTFFLEGKYKSWFACVCFGFVSHASFLLVLPFYFVYKVKTNGVLLGSILFIFLGISFTGLFGNLLHFFLEFIPFYSVKYLATGFASQTTEIGLGYVFRILLVIFCVLLVPSNFIRNLLFFGGVIYIFSGGDLLLMRVSAYFTMFVTIAFPLIALRFKQKIIPFLIMFVLVFFFQTDMNRNNFEYKTIFTNKI